MKLIGYWILFLTFAVLAFGCSAKCPETCPDKCPCCPEKKVEAGPVGCKCGPKCNCCVKCGENCLPCPRRCSPTCPGCHPPPVGVSEGLEVWTEVTLGGELHAVNGLLYVADNDTGDWVELDFSRAPAACRTLTKLVAGQESSWATVVGDWVVGQKRFVVSRLAYVNDPTL